MTAHDVFTWMAAQVPAAKPAAEKDTPSAGRAFTLPPATYQAIADMLAQGMAQGAIARRLGIKFHHVNNLKRRLAAGKGMPEPCRERTTDEQARQLADLLASGCTVRGAAKEIGISESAAYGIVRYKLRTKATPLRKGVPL